MRNFIGRRVFGVGAFLVAAGEMLCGFAGWWDAGADIDEARIYREVADQLHASMADAELRAIIHGETDK